MTTQELIDDVCPKIRDLGWAYYFAPTTLAFGKSKGLNAVRFYFLGRGGVLGDVEGEVVANAFGYFEPSLVTSLWNDARQKMDPAEAGRAYLECAADFGREHFEDVEDLDGFCEAAAAVNDAADPTALTLYSACKVEPLVKDPGGRAMQLLSMLREFRGSAHLLAVRASGLDAKIAHVIARPADIEMFGWKKVDATSITDVEREKLAAAERLTDQLVTPAYDVLDEEGRAVLSTGVARIEAILTARR